MAISIDDLLPVTKEQILDKFVGLLQLAGFPTSSWQSGDFKRHTVESESELYVDLATVIRNVGKAGFIKLAPEIGDEWVDLCAEFFDETRKPAVYTQGLATLTDADGIGPVAIAAGAFWIANADRTLRFVNVDGGTLTLNGTLELTFQAETAGTDWNVGNDELTEILTPQPGVTVRNLAQDNGTWITQQGADVESSSAFVQRCIDKWSTLGAGTDEGAYRYRATSASSEITKCRVYSPGAGAVRVIVAGDAGPVSSSALALAAASIESKRPLGVPDVTTTNCTVNNQTVSGVLYVKAGRDRAAALAAAQGSLNALARAADIGAVVSREQMIKALLVDDVEDLTLTLPAADIELGASEKFVPTYALTTE
jgi:hypothetical protein